MNDDILDNPEMTKGKFEEEFKKLLNNVQEDGKVHHFVEHDDAYMMSKFMELMSTSIKLCIKRNAYDDNSIDSTFYRLLNVTKALKRFQDLNGDEK